MDKSSWWCEGLMLVSDTLTNLAWMDLQFYILFNSISVISGRWADDNERL